MLLNMSFFSSIYLKINSVYALTSAAEFRLEAETPTQQPCNDNDGHDKNDKTKRH